MGQVRLAVALISVALVLATCGTGDVEAAGWVAVSKSPGGAAPPSPAPPAPAPPKAPGGATPAPTPPTPPAPAEAATISVLGIRATNQAKPRIEPRLQSIADELRRSRYNSFQVVQDTTRTAPLGQEIKVPLAEDYALRIQTEKMMGDTVQLTLSWVRIEKDAQDEKQPRVLQRLQMTIRKGKYFLSGGWSLKEGALLAAISAQ